MSVNLESPPAAISGALQPRAELQVRLLGAFQLVCEGRSRIVPMSAQRLIAFLALQDRPLFRAHVFGMLWPGTSEERAAANLRSAVWRVHQVSRHVLQTTRSHLLLGPGVSVDLREVILRAQRLLEGSSSVSDLDVGNFKMDLLEDWYEDWVMVERERFHDLRVRALEALCERLTGMGLFGRAIQSGLAAVAAEPLRETSRRALIKAHLAEGNVFDAIREYSTYRRLLFDELGVDPSPAMLALVEQWKRSV